MPRTLGPTTDDEFSAFVAGSARRLLHAADLLTGDRARAEDLLQHAYAKAYEHWASVRDGAPEAYVRRVMLNRHLDWWRRLRPREAPLQDGDLDRVRAPDHAVDVGRRDAVLRALAGLTAKERAVVVLRFWLDLSEAQIAAELRIAQGTVKSTCARALARLRTDPHLSARADAAAGGPR